MTTKVFGLGPIGQIAISVKDVERATAFYRDVLGMKFLFQFPGMAFFDAGGVRLYLARPEKPEFDHTSILYYRVPSIQEAVTTLEGRGVRFGEPAHIVHQDDRHELWMASFQDSEGNNAVLMSEVPKA
jgi:catechol 2,3-dioxygenase-like lactoylglutathione lyase family enzyme